LTAQEYNFDGIIGPSHFFGGLARDNVASMTHKNKPSNPKQAALQGLQKMKLLMTLGVPQAVLPPHPRPNISVLREMGYSGSSRQILEKVSVQNPEYLPLIYSASSMWTANAATVTPSADSKDRKIHITPANLSTYPHRAVERKFTQVLLKKIFNNPRYFAHHRPLPSQNCDEGAANNVRFCEEYGDPGCHLFVYGRHATESAASGRVLGRQTQEAGKTIARIHKLSTGLSTGGFMSLRQHPEAMKNGIFHNDVIAVGNQTVFLCHDQAFRDSNAIDQIKTMLHACSIPCSIIVAPSSLLSLKDIVETYLFNSQIVTLPNQTMALIAPDTCKHHAPTQTFISKVLDGQNPVSAVHYVDLSESLQNGGGPACLRLRVVLTEAEKRACHPSIFLTPKLYEALVNWVKAHYRDNLSPADLADPQLMDECVGAMDALGRILDLSVMYGSM